MRLKHWISWLWPVRVAEVEGRHGPLRVQRYQGRLLLDSANANQSYGSLHKVWQRAFRRAGIRMHAPARTLLLGLGAGSAVRILHRELGLRTHITAVEDDPEIIGLAGRYFDLHAGPLLAIHIADAFTFLRAHTGRYDLIVVDLFVDLDPAPGVESPAFLDGLQRCCVAGGVVLFNTIMHDEASQRRADLIRDGLQERFGQVDELRTITGNRVFRARAARPSR